MHLTLWLIFRQLYLDFIAVHTAYASEILAQLKKIFLQNQAQKDCGRILKTSGGYDNE